MPGTIPSDSTWLALSVQPAFDRVLPQSTPKESAAAPGGTSLANLMLIVGFALIISVLARYLSGPRRRK